MGAYGNYTSNMSYWTYMTYLVIPAHGGYRKLQSYRMATICYDFGLEFANKYITTRSRTHDQIVQALRSGKQNIVEGSMASGTSKKTELTLLGVARASLEEALQDAEDYIRQHQLKVWSKTDPRSQEIRNLAYRSDKSYTTYMTYLETPESAANCLLCIINQTNYLLDRQIQAVEKEFLEQGGLSERLYKARQSAMPNPHQPRQN